MRSRGTRLLVILAICRALISPAFSQNKLPDIGKILPEFIKKCESDSLYIGDNFDHQERENIKNFKNNTLEDEKTNLYQVEKRGGFLYKKLLERDGIVITNSNFEKKPEFLTVGVGLLGKYDFTFEKMEIIDKSNVLVFSFKPKAGSLTFTGKKEDAYSRMVGEIWISQNDLTFKKLKARLISPVTFSNKWGKAEFQALTCTMRTQVLEGHFAIESFSADYIYTVKAFRFIPILTDRHEIREVQYQNYERRKR